LPRCFPRSCPSRIERNLEMRSFEEIKEIAAGAAGWTSGAGGASASTVDTGGALDRTSCSSQSKTRPASPTSSSGRRCSIRTAAQSSVPVCWQSEDAFGKQGRAA
jgi:hypothetical protein